MSSTTESLAIVNKLKVYDISHIANMLQLRDAGLFEDPMHFSFVMDINSGIPAEPRYQLAMLDDIPEGSSWQIVSMGRAQAPLTTIAVTMGGNMRTGFEDTVHYRRGEPAKDNEQLVQRADRIIHQIGRDVASIKNARRLHHMTPYKTKKAAFAWPT